MHIPKKTQEMKNCFVHFIQKYSEHVQRHIQKPNKLSMMSFAKFYLVN